MGCDGGTKPTRGEQIKVKKRPVVLNPQLKRDAQWKHCQLSNEPLREPVVACELGRLYNKEAVLNFLLNRDSASDVQKNVMRHIRKLKDLKELKMTKPAVVLACSWVCPITGLEMNGLHKFLYLSTCGCVLSDRAIREVPSQACQQCGIAFTAEDMVAINGDDAEVSLLTTRMLDRREKAKLLDLEKAMNKEKARAAAKAPAEGSVDASASAEGSCMPPPPVPAKQKSAPSDTDAQRPPKAKKARMEPCLVQRPGAQEKEWPFSEKTVQETNASKTFKSLFLSSAPQKDPKGSYTSRTTYSR